MSDCSRYSRWWSTVDLHISFLIQIAVPDTLRQSRWASFKWMGSIYSYRNQHSTSNIQHANKYSATRTNPGIHFHPHTHIHTHTTIRSNTNKRVHTMRVNFCSGTYITHHFRCKLALQQYLPFSVIILLVFPFDTQANMRATWRQLNSLAGNSTLPYGERTRLRRLKWQQQNCRRSLPLPPPPPPTTLALTKNIFQYINRKKCIQSDFFARFQAINSKQSEVKRRQRLTCDCRCRAAYSISATLSCMYIQ